MIIDRVRDKPIDTVENTLDEVDSNILVDLLEEVKNTFHWGDIMTTPRKKRIRDKFSVLDDEGKIANTVKLEQKIKRIKIMVKTLLAEIEEIEKQL